MSIDSIPHGKLVHEKLSYIVYNIIVCVIENLYEVNT